MVLPLKAEYRGRIPGIIHRTSDSGATLFVEPAESVELNNTMVRLKEEEQKEITRILGELTQRVRQHAPLILDTLRAMAVLDLIAAKCRYAKKRACVCPEIDPAGVLFLREARHPLLVELFDEAKEDGAVPRHVVPIDVRLGEDFDFLIVTGPNTGGKTVTIKTVGLLALMTQCGIPIPAGEGSRMPVFRDVFIDVGDEQSLQQSLSTFSSHLAVLLDILRGAGSKSLVLIDELGAGTDPDEGAAIGRAVLTELLERKAKVIVTTHLSALKAVAYSTPRVDNAAVEFDPATLAPTFHLRLGEPGNSNALIIAKRLGMPARLVRTAKEFLDDRTGALNKAIEGTLHSRRQAERARREAFDAALEAQRQREQFERQQEELRRSQEAFDRWTQWINALRPGDPVYLKTLRREGRVVRLHLQKQTALITAGTVDIEVPLRDIQIPAQA
jgi:DNA mismatch repair protein MutS2